MGHRIRLLAIWAAMLLAALSVTTQSQQPPPANSAPLDSTSCLYDFERGSIPDCIHKAPTGELSVKHQVLKELQFDSNGLAPVRSAANGWMYVSHPGKVVITGVPTVDNWADTFYDGLVRVVRNGKYGFSNHNGRLVVPTIYDGAMDFESGKAKVCNGCDNKCFDPDCETHVFSGGDWFEIDTKAAVVAVIPHSIDAKCCVLVAPTIPFAPTVPSLVVTESVGASAKPSNQTATGPSFSEVSIKPVGDPDGLRSDGLPLQPNGGIFSAMAQRALDLIATAYNFGDYYYSAVTQLPNWATTETFDVQGRAADNPTPEQMRLMVQSLLADRFKFAMHYEDRQTRFYALEPVNPGKLGVQIRTHKDEAPPCVTESVPIQTGAGTFAPFALCPPPPQRLEVRQAQAGLTRWSFQDVTMQQFATYLTGMGEFDRPVLDRTGLSGTFDVMIEFDRNANNVPEGEAVGPKLFEAIKNQLGLKVVDERSGPAKTLVIDHIEEPTPN